MHVRLMGLTLETHFFARLIKHLNGICLRANQLVLFLHDSLFADKCRKLIILITAQRFKVFYQK